MDKITHSEPKAHELQHAFDLFNQVSLELTQTYAKLEERVASLTRELAVANGELRREYQEKEALSERLSLLLNALPAGVIVLDAEGNISEANPAARRFLGDTPVGGAWRVLVHPELKPTETPDEWHFADRRLAIAESPLDSSGGKLLLIHDVTAAHEQKARMERKERLAAMGEMAASLAHQLRTPLASALLYSANLASPELPEAQRARFAGKAAEQLKRLERLIQDVLLFARGESIGRDRIAVSALLSEAAQIFEPLAAEKSVAFSLSLPTEAAIVTGSRKAILGALLNLLENALQACEASGTIRLSAVLSDRRLKISVSDTGSGISADAQTRIFEPFFTTRGQGTGLGLAIALGVARAHGGSIDARSREGEGSEFTVWLPCADENTYAIETTTPIP